jgi:hypothetical protein
MNTGYREHHHLYPSLTLPIFRSNRLTIHCTLDESWIKIYPPVQIDWRKPGENVL